MTKRDNHRQHEITSRLYDALIDCAGFLEMMISWHLDRLIEVGQQDFADLDAMTEVWEEALAALSFARGEKEF